VGSSLALRAALAGMLGASCGEATRRETTYFDLPTAMSVGGPVLKAPRVQPVYFGSYGFASDTDVFLSDFGKSAYWTAMAAEYGVGPLGVQPGFHPSVALPATLTEAELPGLLDQAFQETGSPLGAADAQTIYALFFPPSTTLSYKGVTLCGEGHPEGYHDEWTVGSANVPVAIFPGCATSTLNSQLTGLDVLTPVISHELVEAATDPYVNTAPAFRAVDANHGLWGAALGGAEVSDLCENEVPSTLTLEGLGHPVQRYWSNLSAQASRGPCLPIPAGEAYFNAIAELGDTALVDNGQGGKVRIPVMKAKLGAAATAELHFRGEEGAPREWQVVAFEVDDPSNPLPAHVTAAAKGGRGVTTSVAVTTGVAPVAGVLPLVLVATDGEAFHFWVGAIDRQ